ncbi:MAG: BlaI/MecI/CopY family transcriptional regulator [Nonomuraea sp.]|nr:BlaI/MecI/CopY family transcriptional regulator [Nonomuraea sp.]NUQ97599.1 BlaI/MecI/CopY family transcriptional regulator [Streptomyces sp.]
MTADDRRPGRRRANGVREAEILAVLQEVGAPLTPGEVVERLGGELTYSSVVTILGRLHDKQLLSRTPRGRAFAYVPVTDDAGMAARRMQGVLEERADRETVLARFVDGLSGSDEELLRQMLGPGPDQSR